MWVLVIVALSSTRWVTVPALTVTEFSRFSLCEDARKELLAKSTVIKEAYCLKLEN